MSKSYKFTQFIVPIIGLTFIFTLLVGLAGCNVPGWIQPQPEQSTPIPVGEVDNPEAQVSFYLEIPANTPTDEPILLSLLDEVTGLALNAKRVPMEQLDDTHYVVTIPFRLGSVIKYRYSRQGEILAEEHTTNGRQVRYRLLHVSDTIEVHDIVARWNDTLHNGPKGRITGTIIDEDNKPVAGVLVTAGGAQVFTAGDGSFLIEGLTIGTHNLVAYSLNGDFDVFQQGALVAEGSNTPANIKFKKRPLVDITFLVHAPEGTVPAVPLRLAGNLLQMGNTFSDLAGGVNTLATRMPVLASLPDKTYGIILSLPVGADVRYKYTLGDGFWNAERAADGSFALRQLIVPDGPAVIEDSIQTWHISDTQEIIFDLIVPETTPPGDQIFIQFNPYGWTEPIPMWFLGGQRWAYILFSPLDMIDQLGYRYCRAGQCGHADDARTPGEFTSGQIVQTSQDRQGIPDKVEKWAWYETQLPETGVTDTKVPGRGADFVAGIELQEYYHPSLDPLYPKTFNHITDSGANWLIIDPSWSYSRLSPPVLEPIPSQDSLWANTINTIQQAQSRDLKIAIQPVPHFPTAISEWWASAPRDFSWWVSWFDNYKAFVLHHAELAAQSNADALILGGEWITPAIPAGTLADGSSSGVPVDANERFIALIAEVRQIFDGTIAWSLPHPEGLNELPGFLNEVDQLVVVWSAPLAKSPESPASELQAEAERILTTDIYSLWLTWKPELDDKSIVINMAYPSANGILTGCLPDPIVECLPPSSLNYPAPDYPLIELDMQSQARAYDAVLAAVNKQDWIDGVISSGYFSPTVLHDKSTSVHGKPAEGVLRSWYTRLLRE